MYSSAYGKGFVTGGVCEQVEQLNRQLADKDKELAAMEESLDILAPVDSNGERALKGNLSAADAQRLEALQDCISSGSTKQASRIKCESPL